MNKKDVEREFMRSQLQRSNIRSQSREHTQEYKERQYKSIYQNQQLFIFEDYNRQDEITY